MARRGRRATLQRLLLSIAVVGVTVYGGFWTVWTWNRLGDERDRAEAGVRRSAQRAAAAFAGFLNDDASVADVAATLAPQVMEDPGCTGSLPDTWPVAADGRAIGRYDLVRSDGSVQCSTDPSLTGRAAGNAGAPWLAASYRPGERTSNYRDPATGRPVWAIAVPVGNTAAPGLLAAVVELGPASEQLRLLLGDGSKTEFLVWDVVSGEVLSRPTGSSWTPREASGRIVASEMVPTTNWRLAAAVQRSDADARAWAEFRAAGLALAAAMAALALTTTLVHRRIVRPLGAITAAARRTAEGGTTSLEEEGPAELAELAGALNDLTASRDRNEQLLAQAAESLTHSLERLDVVLASSADMVLIVDGDGRVTFASHAVMAVCGPAARTGAHLSTLVHPDDADAAAGLVGAEGMAFDAAVVLRMGDGGGSWRYVDMMARDLRSHPAVRGTVLNGRDVTDRQAEAEQRAALDEQLHQSQRLEGLGALAGGIAHDFKNLLSVIMGTAELAAQHVPDGAPRQELGELRAAASRGVGLAQQLLTFSRRDEVPAEALDVSKRLLSMADLLRRTLGENIHLDLRVEEPLPAVRLNRSRFDQALLNLAVNARDAMDGGGRLVVAAQEVTDPADAGLDPGRYVVVSVSDPGAGMSPEVAARAFEPFFTTKSPGHGSGLGLAIVHGVVTAAGGSAHIRSTPGEGTTVRLVLPASPEPAPAAPPGADPVAMQGAGEIVLVVEDHEPLRALVQRMLRAGNYGAVGAADGARALKIAADRGQRVDLVLTDLLMPGMSGAELAARITELRPDLPVVFMSAYSAEIFAGTRETGAPPLLEKPFSQAQLLSAVHLALSAAETAAGR